MSSSVRPNIDTEKCEGAMVTLPYTPSSPSSSDHSPAPSLNIKPFEFKNDPETLPQKHGSSGSRYLQHTFFSGYRRIFSVVFFVNLAVLIALIVRNRGTPRPQDIGAAASSNLMVTILFRQENFVNLLYELATCAPHWLPLYLRRRLAYVFHYGGFHSGAGVAAVTWYFLYTIVATREYALTHRRDQIANVVTSYILVIMFTTILGSAWPVFRVNNHDRFEVMHRFAGWIAVVTFWAHTITAAGAYATDAGMPLGKYIVRTPNFWTIIISTMCSVLSWGRLRYHKVYPEILSDHAIRLHFKYMTMAPFYGVKISSNPLTEWHAFATIPDDDGSGRLTGFSVVVSNAGDWTKKNIHSPPKKLWVRGYPLHGLLYTSRLFKKIVVVATGSGIGPCLSLLYANVTPRRVLWSTPHPEVTYGQGIINAVRKADPEAIIWNTRTQGRPDVVSMTYALVLESQAEAVFVISNPKVTQKVVYGMESRGIAAYGAIFDS